MPPHLSSLPSPSPLSLFPSSAETTDQNSTGRAASVVSLPRKSDSRNANSATVDGAAPYRKAVSGAATDRPISRLGIWTICLLIALCRCVACCRYRATSRMSPYPSVTPGPRSARIQIYQPLPDRWPRCPVSRIRKSFDAVIIKADRRMSEGFCVLRVSFSANRPLIFETVQRRRPVKSVSVVGS